MDACGYKIKIAPHGAFFLNFYFNLLGLHLGFIEKITGYKNEH